MCSSMHGPGPRQDVNMARRMKHFLAGSFLHTETHGLCMLSNTGQAEAPVGIDLMN